MASVFDGLADIFVETFGEAEGIDYVAGGITTRITAIWLEFALDAAFDGVDVDQRQTRLHLRASDVADPKEGDIAVRIADGKSMRVTPPILPDGKGMIACNLSN